MEHLSLNFKIVGNEQVEQAEINFVGTADRPLIEAAASLSNIHLKPSITRSEGEEIYFKSCVRSFQNSLLWVLFHHSKQINRTEFLETFPFVKKEEARGKLALSLFDLAHHTLDLAHKSKKSGSTEIPPYSDGLSWWKLCMVELLLHYFESTERVGTTALGKEFDQEIAALEQYESRTSDSDRSRYPHLTCLLETAMALAKFRQESNQLKRDRKDFRRFQWQQFIERYEDLKEAITQPGIAYLYLKGGNLYIRLAQPKKNLPREIRVSQGQQGFKSGRGRKKGFS